MSKTLKRLAYLNGGLVGGTYFFYAKKYPELGNDPYKVTEAIKRGLRCYSTGALMLSDYYFAKETTSEIHTRAATRLFNCFAANAGSYIKLG